MPREIKGQRCRPRSSELRRAVLSPLQRSSAGCCCRALAQAGVKGYECGSNTAACCCCREVAGRGSQPCRCRESYRRATMGSFSALLQSCAL